MRWKRLANIPERGVWLRTMRFVSSRGGEVSGLYRAREQLFS
jgi:hypothetical protein